MPKNVQIRNVDDTTYEVLRKRAADSDLSLTQYLRRELDHLASMPSMAEWLAEGDRWRAKYGGVPREAVEAAFADNREEQDRRT